MMDRKDVLPYVVSLWPHEWDMESSLIYLSQTGSVAYGLQTPTSDVDLYGIIAPPKRFVIGLKDWTHWERKTDDVDAHLYSLTRFCGLMTNGNPNVAEALWTPEHCILVTTPVSQMLRANRHLFLSQAIGRAALAYSKNHLMRSGTMTNEDMGEKRRTIVERHGYDTRAATHGLRWLRMAKEACETHRIIVDRTDLDQEELMQVKMGKVSLPAMQNMFTKHIAEVEEALAKTTLQKEADFEAVDALLVKLNEAVYGYSRG